MAIEPVNEKDEKIETVTPKIKKTKNAEVFSDLVKESEPTQELTQKIYVGPNLLELQKYTVVENKFTPHIEDVIKKCPSVDKLFVKIKDMAYVEERTKEKGTLEHRHFNKVIEYASGKDE